MLDFRGTQLLQLEGRPIAQIAFQSETGKPVAICIIKTPRPAEEPTTDRRQGLNIVHWVADGYGSNHIHRYSKSGTYIGSINGTEGAAGAFAWQARRNRINRRKRHGA